MSLTICFEYLGIFLLVISLVANVYIRLFLIGICCLWLLVHKEYKALCLFVICLFIFFLRSNITVSMPMKIEGNVIAVRDGSFVVSMKEGNIWVHSDDHVNFDDVVVVIGDLQRIASTDNRVGFSFEKWCKSQNIVYQCYADEVHIVKKGKSFRASVFLMLDTFPLETKMIMKMFLFHIYDHEYEWLYLSLSFGIHISFLLNGIRKYASLFLLEKDVDCLVFLCNLLIGFFYHWDFICVRLLLRNGIRKLPIDKKKQWGLLTCILLLLYPELVGELKFLMPVLLGLVQAFCFKKMAFSGDIIFVLLQLWFQGYVSLSQVLWAKCIRPLFSMTYCFCLLRIWIPFDGLFSLIYHLLYQYKSISLDGWCLFGKPSIFLCILVVFLLVRYVVLLDRKYLVLIGFLLVLNHFQNYYQWFARVVYIDVGQGDSTLVILPFHKGNVLIDTGGSLSYDVAKDILYPVLSSYGISSLDLVILTHEDLDHSGAYESLKRYVKIKQMVDYKMEVYPLRWLTLYDGLYDYEYEDGNANSLTVCFDIYGSTFLVLGDIGKEQEFVLMKKYDAIDIDYVKLAHHGSDTSTSNKLLQITKPLYAIISVGKNNRYGHPSQEVLYRLSQYKIPYLSTADCGAIEVRCYLLGDCIETASKLRIWIKKMR